MSEPKKPWRRKRRWAAVAAALLVAYPASLGPAVALWANGLMPEAGVAALTVFYAPLGVVATTSPAARGALGWYVRLWGETDLPPGS